jgi:hypothetical protein
LYLGTEGALSADGLLVQRLQGDGAFLELGAEGLFSVGTLLLQGLEICGLLLETGFQILGAGGVFRLELRNLPGEGGLALGGLSQSGVELIPLGGQLCNLAPEGLVVVGALLLQAPKVVGLLLETDFQILGAGGVLSLELCDLLSEIGFARLGAMLELLIGGDLLAKSCFRGEQARSASLQILLNLCELLVELVLSVLKLSFGFSVFGFCLLDLPEGFLGLSAKGAFEVRALLLEGLEAGVGILGAGGEF